MSNRKIICLSLLAALAMPPAMAGEGLMMCRASAGEEARQWLVRLRLGTVQGEVDGQMVPADYQPSHVRLRLPDGSSLTIGRASGRLVQMDENGRPLSSGVCGLAGQRV